MQNNPTHKAKTLDDQWIEGWYDGSYKHELVIWIAYPNDDNLTHVQINPTTLCRSTYRQDSNGNMMYEGDEVEVDGRLFTIEWSKEYVAFGLSSGEFFHEIAFQITLTGKNKHD
jgi:hypothetical protein